VKRTHLSYVLCWCRRCCCCCCSAAGLVPLVEWNTRREIDTNVAELQEGLEKMMSADHNPVHHMYLDFLRCFCCCCCCVPRCCLVSVRCSAAGLVPLVEWNMRQNVTHARCTIL
jgi:fructose-bisphosphate aldolase class 1